MTESAIDRVLTSARSRITPRAQPEEVPAALAAGALLVDTRPSELRQRDGVLPGAVVVERNVLEWRLDPTSPHRLTEMDDPARRVIVVCDEGYASSLAAAALLDLGLTNVTDLDGGYQAWTAYRSGR
jgi:rhodanese-related sulfurtransferase